MKKIQTKKSFFKIQKILFFSFIALSTVALLFTLFHNLGNNAIADWDEARHGINAYEMVKSNNWIINTYQYEPDFWNLKPPLSYYLIAISYQIFGFNAFSLRLYSAISIILVFFISLISIYRYRGKLSVVLFGITFLSFSEFFMGHCGRTADADALFLLFYLISMISLVASHKHTWTLYIFGLSFSLAFLSKSFHATTIMLIAILYIIFSKLYKELKIKDYIITALTSSMPILIWAVFRYLADGWSFLGIMFGVDVTERINGTTNNLSGYLFFIKYLLTNRSTQIMITVIVLCYIVQAIINKSIKLKIDNFTLLLILWIMLNVIFFTMTRTQATWYYYPTFLSLILLTSSILNDTILLLKDNGIKAHILIFAFTCAFSGLFVSYGLLHICKNIASTFNIKETEAQNAIMEFAKANPSFDGYNCYFVKSKSEDAYPYEIQRGKWEQCDVLCAELNGDYKCINGGFEKFVDDKNNSIVFIEKSLYNEYEKSHQFEQYDCLTYTVLVNQK